ncbi:TPA: cupin domain-containing protein [Candidatus Bathyarchaeota archaeon]|nr:cupin domain-containing protein [Candidatus Bathyarchaeota archaeon]
MWSVIDSEKIPFSPYRKGVSNIKRILDRETVGSKRFTGFGLLEVPPREGVFLPHTHPDREEIYYVLSGSGTILVEDREIPAKEGLTVYVSGELPHGIRNQTDEPLMILYVHAQV